VSRGVGTIGPETGVPTLFGVITADTMEQAIDRAGLKAGNIGWHAASAAIATVNVLAKIRGDAGMKR
jgi:6,7-dimethyl-8-ribityllumazine synthase